MMEDRIFVCPKWNCTACLILLPGEHPDLPCGKHFLKMVPRTKWRRRYSMLKFRASHPVWYLKNSRKLRMLSRPQRKNK